MFNYRYICGLTIGAKTHFLYFSTDNAKIFNTCIVVFCTMPMIHIKQKTFKQH